MSPRRYPQMGARQLIRELRGVFGYETMRQRGSHIRMRTVNRGVHSITIPNHEPLQMGTLAGIMKDVAKHFDLDEEEVLARIQRTRERRQH